MNTLIVLVVVSTFSIGIPRIQVYNSMSECQKSVDGANIVIPNGDENERAFAMFCTRLTQEEVKLMKKKWKKWND